MMIAKKQSIHYLSNKNYSLQSLKYLYWIQFIYYFVCIIQHFWVNHENSYVEIQ